MPEGDLITSFLQPHIPERQGQPARPPRDGRWSYSSRELVKIDGRITGEHCVEIVKEILLPSVSARATPISDTTKRKQDRSPIRFVG